MEGRQWTEIPPGECLTSEQSISLIQGPHQAFARELDILRKTRHPNTVNFIGFVEDHTNGVAWIVFPWQSNGNVRQFLSSGDWGIPERTSLVR